MQEATAQGSETALSRPPDREANLARFELELEFVQGLSSPFYLHTLATDGYFKDEAFLNYLKYMEYWREPDYVRFIVYPICLFYLDLLKHKSFRDSLVDANVVAELARVGNAHWATWRAEKKQKEGNDSGAIDGDTQVIKQDNETTT